MVHALGQLSAESGQKAMMSLQVVKSKSFTLGSGQFLTTEGALMAKPLPEAIEAEVARLVAEAEELADDEEDARALALFQAGWELIPEPKAEWQRALQVLGGIADSQFHLGEYEACRRTMQLALRSGGGPNNPFICLRLGQCHLELGDEHGAGNWLTSAMLVGGLEIFEGEDPKYWAFLRKQLDPPPGGWPAGW